MRDALLTCHVFCFHATSWHIERHSLHIIFLKIPIESIDFQPWQGSSFEYNGKDLSFDRVGFKQECFLLRTEFLIYIYKSISL